MTSGGDKENSVSKTKRTSIKSKSGVFFNPHNEDNVMLEKIFDVLDRDGKGVIRSYDVYLSKLGAEEKNLIHEILEDANSGGNFAVMDYEGFIKVIKQSGKMDQVRTYFD